jgi:hypothetical protein
VATMNNVSVILHFVITRIYEIIGVSQLNVININYQCRFLQTSLLRTKFVR